MTNIDHNQSVHKTPDGQPNNPFLEPPRPEDQVQVPDSIEAGYDTRFREFDNTTLQSAVDQDLIILPESPRSLTSRRRGRWIAGIGGVAALTIAAGSALLLNGSESEEEPTTLRSVPGAVAGTSPVTNLDSPEDTVVALTQAPTSVQAQANTTQATVSTTDAPTTTISANQALTEMFSPSPLLPEGARQTGEYTAIPMLRDEAVDIQTLTDMFYANMEGAYSAKDATTRAECMYFLFGERGRGSELYLAYDETSDYVDSMRSQYPEFGQGSNYELLPEYSQMGEARLGERSMAVVRAQIVEWGIPNDSHTYDPKYLRILFQLHMMPLEEGRIEQEESSFWVVYSVESFETEADLLAAPEPDLKV